MPRPCCPRHVGCQPQVVFFKPAGVPLSELECVTLSLDELEALRLADLNGLYQEQAAEQMKISRPTFARVVEQARRKVADALVHGKALRLEGGAVIMTKEINMPARDGTGPLGGGRGKGRGRCGCGRGQGFGQQNGVGRGRRGRGRGAAGMFPAGAPVAKTTSGAKP